MVVTGRLHGMHRRPSGVAVSTGHQHSVRSLHRQPTECNDGGETCEPDHLGTPFGSKIDRILNKLYRLFLRQRNQLRRQIWQRDQLADGRPPIGGLNGEFIERPRLHEFCDARPQPLQFPIVKRIEGRIERRKSSTPKRCATNAKRAGRCVDDANWDRRCCRSRAIEREGVPAGALPMRCPSSSPDPPRCSTSNNRFNPPSR